jgi:N-methylhydantoinase A
MMATRVASDIGGTFTDLVFFDEAANAVEVSKALSTPHDLTEGVVETLRLAGLIDGDIDDFIHGCTIVINAITEGKGVRTALVTTKGFRDVLEIGRGNRPDLYNMRFEKPRPFVPRRLRFEVRERMDHQGRILLPLSRRDLEAVAAACARAEVRAVAICYLHAYANPDHEVRTARFLRRRLPGVAVSMSSDITREWREYERSNTVVLNAYVQPIAEEYLKGLERVVGRQRRTYLHIMQSNGGTTTFSHAKARPIQIIESGPVAGVIGAAAVGQLVGERNVISLDIGGTTAKCSLVEDGQPRVTTEYKLFQTRLFPGYPVKIPVVDIVEIGAGGGSIAWLESTGALRVGPVSAGADPGPACYGRGGTLPTVTDAMLLAGVLNPDYFLGGRLRLDQGQARGAIASLAARMDTSIESAATSIIRLVNANMINALKLISVQRGHDPRDFVLVASGGGGPMHAAALAEELGIKEVLIPNYPGYFSAWGMLMTEPRIDLVRTQLARTTETTVDKVEEVFAEMAREILQQYATELIAPEGVVFARSLDARYHGQDHTVTVAFNGTPATMEQIEALFHAVHKKTYTFDLLDTPVEIVSYRLTGVRRAAKPELPRLPAAPRPAGVKSRRSVDFGEGGVREAAVFERSSLPPDFGGDGPAIVEEVSSTTVVPPGHRFHIDAFGQLHVHLPV